MDHLDEIIGQEIAKRFLRNALRKECLYNLLLAGPRGVGKRTTAFALAKTLGCPFDSPSFMLVAPVPPLDKEEKMDEYLKNYLPGNATVHIEDRATIGINQIRRLVERLLLLPQKEKKRVVIILEADRMNEEAANAFLKTLEEPPLDTIFILTSSRPEYLIPTIRSRCQIVKFSYLKPEEIKNIIFDGEDKFFLGSPGEILFLRESNTMEIARNILKKTPFSVAAAAKLVKEFEEEKLAELLYALLILYRNLLYKQLHLSIVDEFDEELTRKAQKISREKLIDILLFLNSNINSLEYNPNYRILLLNTFLRLP